MKIIVAYDGSVHSHRMLEQLLDKLVWFRGQPPLTVLSVHLPLPYPRAVAWVGEEAVREYYDEECDAVLDQARPLLDAHDVLYSAEKQVGDPAMTIVEVAQRDGYDLIVMGTHGRTGLLNVVMGSVATKVLANSKVPVLFFR
ncbi:MAG TPA: universal stress protein [Burkholderiaceae bacterium]|nr:universal stress protein [Burkholderiaceae bacterium]